MWIKEKTPMNSNLSPVLCFSHDNFKLLSIVFLMFTDDDSNDEAVISEIQWIHI